MIFHGLTWSVPHVDFEMSRIDGVGRHGLDETAKILGDGFRERNASVSRQELDQPEHVVAMLFDVIAINALAVFFSGRQIKKRARFERDEQLRPRMETPSTICPPLFKAA